MAELVAHQSQAIHNETLAVKLCNDPPNHDWAIVLAFYAAIHYFECYQYNRGDSDFNRHTEAQAENMKGDLQSSLHKIRKEIIRKNFNRDIYTHYVDLEHASKVTRYLTDGKNFTCRSSDFFTQDEAKEFIAINLKEFKDSLDI